MTSAQLWSQRHHSPWVNVIRADFQTVISRYLQNVKTRIFCTADTMFRTIIMQNSRLIYACLPIKIDVISAPSVLNDCVGSLMTVSPCKWRYSIPAYECHLTIAACYVWSNSCLSGNKKAAKRLFSFMSSLQILSFKTRFPKSGPTYKRQVFNPRHQTLRGQSVAKSVTPLQNILVWNVDMT